MCARYFRLILRTSIVAIFGVFVLASASMAQQLTPQQFQANPGQLLANNPNGGSQLISQISQLAQADPADLPLIITLLANASSNQATAIGTGLGQAALALLAATPPNQAYATQIQNALIVANNANANTAYAAVTGNTLIGGVAGAGGGGIGGGGGGGGGGIGGFSSSGSSSGSSFSSSSSGTPNTPHTSFTSSFTSGTTPGGTSTTIRSVSP
jgi:hypothetical protein